MPTHCGEPIREKYGLRRYIGSAEIFYRKALDIYELRLESDPEQIEEKRREMALLLQAVHIMNQ